MPRLRFLRCLLMLIAFALSHGYTGELGTILLHDPDLQQTGTSVRALLSEISGLELRSEHGLADLPPQWPDDETDPYEWVKAHRILGVDLVLRLSGTSGDGAVLSAYEFPSGILVGRLILSDARSGHVARFLAALPGRWSEEGFPFAPEEAGAILLTDTDNSERTARMLRAAALYGPVKILDPAAMTQDPCEWALAANERLGAMLTIFDGEIATLAYSFSRQQGSRAEIKLPYLPGRPELSCIRIHGGLPERINGISGNGVPGDSRIERLVANLLAHRRLNSEPPEGDRAEIARNYAELLYGIGADAPEKGWIALNYAGLLHDSGETDEAAVLFERADSGFVLHADTLGLIIAAVAAAQNAGVQSDWSSAEEHYLKALHYAGASGDRASEARITLDLAMTYELAGDVEKARRSYELASQKIADSGDPYSAAGLYEHLGQISRDNGELDRAGSYFTTLMTKSDELRSEPIRARAHFYIGTVALAGGRRTDALKSFSAAADLMEMLGDSLGLARVDHYLGILHTANGEKGAAMESYKSAIRRFERQRVYGDAVLSLRNLGELQAGDKSWDRAQNSYDRALELLPRGGETGMRASLIYLKGLAHLKQGRLKTGYEEVKRAIEISGGAVHGSAQESEAFLHKLEELIGEIQQIHEEAHSK